MLNLKLPMVEAQRIAALIPDEELSIKMYEAIYSNPKFIKETVNTFDKVAYQQYQEQVRTIRYNHALDKLTNAMYQGVNNKQTRIRVGVLTEDVSIYNECVAELTQKGVKATLKKTSLKDMFISKIDKSYHISIDIC